MGMIWGEPDYGKGEEEEMQDREMLGERKGE